MTAGGVLKQLPVHPSSDPDVQVQREATKTRNPIALQRTKGLHTLLSTVVWILKPDKKKGPSSGQPSYRRITPSQQQMLRVKRFIVLLCTWIPVRHGLKYIFFIKT